MSRVTYHHLVPENKETSSRHAGPGVGHLRNQVVLYGGHLMVAVDEALFLFEEMVFITFDWSS